VTDQLQSAEHGHSVKASDKHQQKVASGLNAGAINRTNETLLAMRSCYWMATGQVPNVKYKSQGMWSRACRAVIFNQLLV